MINTCTRCIMDTSDPDITFDAHGICNHCRNVERTFQSPPIGLTPEEKRVELNCLVEKIRSEGKKRKYDCIIGVSGGVDSTFTAYQVVKLGLRPLAVHLDNGWNSELAVKNIENICKRLKIDLFTYVIDWEEFKDLQLSFLKASTPDSEIPTDHAIVAILYRMALREKVRTIAAGGNFMTESIMPQAWSHGHYDWKYIRSVQKLFGTKKLRSFPHIGTWDFFYYKNIRRIEWFRPLDYIPFHKPEAMKIIKEELGWQDYGGKHHESIYTKFFQAYILPVKFGYDKRKAHYSSLICAGQMTRDEAWKALETPLYTERQLKEDKQYVANKFGIPLSELERILSLPNRSFWDYPSHEKSAQAPVYRFFRNMFYSLRHKNRV